MTYIFFDNNKWFLHDGELPVKPENATATIISQMNYAKAIADIKSKALEIDNPEILGLEFIIRPNEIVFTEWPGSYERKDGHRGSEYEVGIKVVAHLVLPPKGDFKPVYMDQGTVPTERMNHEGNFKTEQLKYRNQSNLSYADCCMRLTDDSRRFEDMPDEDLDSIYAVATGRWAYHLTRQAYIDTLYKEREKRNQTP